MSYGGQNMVEPLRRVLVRPPDAAFGEADPQRWHYAGVPDLAAARQEHDVVVAILRQAGATVHVHDEPLEDHADAIFVHDPVLVTDGGAILLRMGKVLRRGEEEAMARVLGRLDVPVRARLTAPAVAEGGDLMWVDGRTLAVGQGYRTDAEGLRQLRRVLEPDGIECVPVPLPVFSGPDACLHLMSLISMIDHDLAVAHVPLLPVPFREMLRDRGIDLVPVPEAELATQGPNVLALAPRSCLMLEDNPATRAGLEAAGCTVRTYRGRELSLKAEGGATCLTRPLWRSPQAAVPGEAG